MNFSENVRSAFRRGETDAVVRMSEAEIERAQAAGDPAGEVEARYSLARVVIHDGDLPGGEARAREALEVALRSGDRSLEERPRHVLAAVARMSGDLLRARDLYRESIALNEALDQLRSFIHGAPRSAGPAQMAGAEAARHRLLKGARATRPRAAAAGTSFTPTSVRHSLGTCSTLPPHSLVVA